MTSGFFIYWASIGIILFSKGCSFSWYLWIWNPYFEWEDIWATVKGKYNRNTQPQSEQIGAAGAKSPQISLYGGRARVGGGWGSRRAKILLNRKTKGWVWPSYGPFRAQNWLIWKDIYSTSHYSTRWSCTTTHSLSEVLCIEVSGCLLKLPVCLHMHQVDTYFLVKSWLYRLI